MLILLKDWQKTSVELWRPVASFAGYEISNQGRLRSFRQKGGNKHDLRTRSYNRPLNRTFRILSPANNGKGYLYYYLYRGGVRHMCSAHRLVAHAFLAPQMGRDVVNHKNNVSTDNRIDNLEWATHKENSLHAKQIGVWTRGEMIGRSRFVDADILRIRELCASGVPQVSVAQQYNCGASAIGSIVRRRTWAHL